MRVRNFDFKSNVLPQKKAQVGICTRWDIAAENTTLIKNNRLSATLAYTIKLYSDKEWENELNETA